MLEQGDRSTLPDKHPQLAGKLALDLGAVGLFLGASYVARNHWSGRGLAIAGGIGAGSAAGMGLGLALGGIGDVESGVGVALYGGGGLLLGAAAGGVLAAIGSSQPGRQRFLTSAAAGAVWLGATIPLIVVLRW